MYLSQQTNPFQNAGRWMAIVAMMVLSSGKLVHLGQECNGECGDSHCLASSNKTEKSTYCCPYGCTHHADGASEKSDKDESGEQEHDEHQCAVCSVLSHVTECPAIAGLPDVAALVTQIVPRNSASPLTGARISAHSRGPPADV